MILAAIIEACRKKKLIYCAEYTLNKEAGFNSAFNMSMYSVCMTETLN